jgi:CheY-like chemotaxis protein
MLERCRILIVEDNDRNRKLFHLLIDSMGLVSILAGDGEEGLRKAREEAPDLVLLDIQMPGLDGLTVLARLRHDSRTRQVPVIAVTSCAMPGDRERLLSAGFAEYLAKPIDTRLFKQVVTGILRDHGQR